MARRPRKPRNPAPIRPRLKDARAYEQALRQSFLDPFFARLKQQLAGAAAADQALRTIQNVVGRMLAQPRAGIPLLEIQKALNRLNGYHKQRLVDTFRRALGVDISSVLADSAIRSVMDQAITDNVAMISTIPQRAQAGLTTRLQQQLQTRPFDQQMMTQTLTTQYAVSGWDVRRIARDQTSKTIGRLTQTRHAQLGIDSYQWLTSQDNAVRVTHQMVSGRIFHWSKPPVETNGNHPGGEIMCRCVAIPQVDPAAVARLRGDGAHSVTGFNMPAPKEQKTRPYLAPPAFPMRHPGLGESTQQLMNRINVHRLLPETVMDAHRMHPNYVGIDAMAVVETLYKEFKKFKRALRSTIKTGKALVEPMRRLNKNLAKKLKPLKADTRVYRGVPEKTPDGKPLALPSPGDDFITDSWVSTSSSASIADEAGEVMWDIQARKGSRALVTNDRKGEVIVPPGTKISVLDVVDCDDRADQPTNKIKCRVVAKIAEEVDSAANATTKLPATTTPPSHGDALMDAVSDTASAVGTAIDVAVGTGKAVVGAGRLVGDAISGAAKAADEITALIKRKDELAERLSAAMQKVKETKAMFDDDFPDVVQAVSLRDRLKAAVDEVEGTIKSLRDRLTAPAQAIDRPASIDAPRVPAARPPVTPEPDLPPPPTAIEPPTPPVGTHLYELDRPTDVPIDDYIAYLQDVDDHLWEKYLVVQKTGDDLEAAILYDKRQIVLAEKSGMQNLKKQGFDTVELEDVPYPPETVDKAPLLKVEKAVGGGKAKKVTETKPAPPAPAPVATRHPGLTMTDADWDKLGTDSELKFGDHVDTHRGRPDYIDDRSDPSLNKYVGSESYIELNNQAREIAKGTRRELDEHLKDMDAGLARLQKPIAEDTRVFRGEPKDFSSPNIRAGDEIEAPHWTSTSTMPHVAMSYSGTADEFGNLLLDGTVWDIRIPKGVNTLVTNAEFGEIVLPPGTKLKILKVDTSKPSASARVITADVVPDELTTLREPGLPVGVHPALGQSFDDFGDSIQEMAKGWQKARNDLMAMDAFVDEQVNEAIGHYVMDSEALNKALREGRKLKKNHAAINAQMTELLRETEDDLRVFRGVPGESDVGPGSVVDFEHWASSSLSPSTAKAFASPKGDVWDIRVPSGSNVIATNPGELEVILPPKTRVRVLEVHERPKDFEGYESVERRIVAEVVPDEPEVPDVLAPSMDDLKAQLDELERESRITTTKLHEAQDARVGLPLSSPRRAELDAEVMRLIGKTNELQASKKAIQDAMGDLEPPPASAPKTVVPKTAVPKPAVPDLDPDVARPHPALAPDAPSLSDLRDEHEEALFDQSAAHMLRPDYMDPSRSREVDSYVYGMGVYEDVNSALRSGRSASSDESKVISGMLEAMSPLRNEERVFRGVQLDWIPEAGELVEDAAFLSTTRSVDVAHRFAQKGSFPEYKVVFDIKVPAGTPAIVTNADLLEVIFAPKTRLRVVEVRKDGDVHHVITEMVPDEDVSVRVPVLDLDPDVARPHPALADDAGSLFDEVQGFRNEEAFNRVRDSHRELPTYVPYRSNEYLEEYVQGSGPIPDVHFYINETLREGKKLPDYLHRINTGLTDLLTDLPEEMRVFRGYQVARAPKAGDLLADDGWMSTSRNADTASEFILNPNITKPDRARLLVDIRLPKGTPSIVTNAPESEVILPPGTRLKVRKVVDAELTDNQDGNIHPVSHVIADLVPDTPAGRAPDLDVVDDIIEKTADDAAKSVSQAIDAGDILPASKIDAMDPDDIMKVDEGPSSAGVLQYTDEPVEMIDRKTAYHTILQELNDRDPELADLFVKRNPINNPQVKTLLKLIDKYDVKSITIVDKKPWRMGARLLGDEPVLGATQEAFMVKKISGPLGSHPGGIYEGTDGVQRYVKKYKDPTQAYGENVANTVYRRLGVDAPESDLFEFDGQPGIASIIIDNDGIIGASLDQDQARKILDGFLADVLVDNWDAVGTGRDNIVRIGKDIARIDQGGAFLHRALGARKPPASLMNIDEWENFTALNADYASVFKTAGLQNADDARDWWLASLKQQVEDIKRLRLESNEFADLVPEQIGVPKADRDAMLTMLRMRASKLEQKVRDMEPQPAPPPASLPSISVSPSARVAYLENLQDKLLTRIIYLDKNAPEAAEVKRIADILEQVYEELELATAARDLKQATMMIKGQQVSADEIMERLKGDPNIANLGLWGKMDSKLDVGDPRGYISGDTHPALSEAGWVLPERIKADASSSTLAKSEAFKKHPTYVDADSNEGVRLYTIPDDLYYEEFPDKGIVPYHKINAYLRDGKVLEDTVDELESLNAKMTAALKPLPNDMRLYRGEADMPTPKVGEVVKNDGWTSTSTSTFAPADMPSGFYQSTLHMDLPRDAEPNLLLWDIRAPKGTNAIVTNPNLEEIILAPGARLKVVDVRRMASPDELPDVPRYQVIAEVVPDEADVSDLKPKAPHLGAAEKATANTTKTHVDVPGYVDEAKYPKSLSVYVHDDIFSKHHHNLNEELLAVDNLGGTLDPKALAANNEMMKLLKPLQDDMVLYRGMKDGLDDVQVGDEITSAAWTSTSRQARTAREFSEDSGGEIYGIIEVRAPSGTSAIVTNAGEAEVIFPPKSMMRVVQVTELTEPKYKGAKYVVVDLDPLAVPEPKLTPKVKPKPTPAKEISPEEITSRIETIREFSDDEDFIKFSIAAAESLEEHGSRELARQFLSQAVTGAKARLFGRSGLANIYDEYLAGKHTKGKKPPAPGAKSSGALIKELDAAPVVPVSSHPGMDMDAEGFKSLLKSGDDIEASSQAHRDLPTFVDHKKHSALKEYVSAGEYEVVNIELNSLSYGGALSPEIKAINAGMTELLAPLPTGQRLFRGVRTWGFEEVQAGDDVLSTTWLSTSSVPQVSASFGSIYWDIYVPAGMRAIVTNPREAEFILPPGTVLHVLKVEEFDVWTGKRIVAEVRDQDEYPLISKIPEPELPAPPPTPGVDPRLTGSAPHAFDLMDKWDISDPSDDFRALRKEHLGHPNYVDPNKNAGVQAYMNPMPSGPGRGPVHEELNINLRLGRELSGNLEKVNADMTAALKPLPEELRLFRGGQGAGEGRVLEVGEEIDTEAWLSTTRNPSVAQMFLDEGGQHLDNPVIWDIRAPAGSNAIVTNVTETEVILPPKTKLKVLKIDQKSEAHIPVVIADLIPDDLPVPASVPPAAGKAADDIVEAVTEVADTVPVMVDKAVTAAVLRESGLPQYNAGREADLIRKLKEKKKEWRGSTKYPPTWLAQMKMDIADDIVEGLDDIGTVVAKDAGIKDVEGALRDTFSEDRVAQYIAIKMDNLVEVVATERIKGSSETGKGAFYIIGDERFDSYERRVFDLPRDTPVEDRPKYGFIDSKDGITNEKILQLDYGENYIRLKPGVRERSTVTLGDSIGGNVEDPYSDMSFNLTPAVPLADVSESLLDTYAVHRAFMRNQMAEADPNKDDYDKKQAKAKRREMLDKLKEWGRTHDHNALLAAATSRDVGYYIETQVHGKLTLDDVDAIMMQSRQDAGRIRTMLFQEGYKDIKVVAADHDTRLAAVTGPVKTPWHKRLGPEDLQRLRDEDVVKVLDGHFANEYIKDLRQIPESLDVLRAEYLEKLGEVGDKHSPELADVTRRYITEFIRLQEMGREGGLPLITTYVGDPTWELYEPAKTGWTADMLNKNLLRTVDEAPPAAAPVSQTDDLAGALTDLTQSVDGMVDEAMAARHVDESVARLNLGAVAAKRKLDKIAWLEARAEEGFSEDMIAEGRRMADALRNAEKLVQEASGVDDLAAALQETFSPDRVGQYMAMPETVLRKVIKDKFKTSYETGKGSFKTIGQDRFEAIERPIFGLSEDALENPSDLPKYGFIAGKDNMDWDKIVGHGYGETFVRFKPSVRERSTVTFTDSFDGNDSKIRMNPPTPLNDVTTDFVDGAAERITGGGSSEELTRQRWKEWAESRDYKDLSAAGGHPPYIETQIFGELTMADVDAIIVESKKAMKRLRRDLDKAGFQDVEIIPGRHHTRLKQIWEGDARGLGSSVSSADIDRLGDPWMDKLMKDGAAGLLGSWKDLPESIEVFRRQFAEYSKGGNRWTAAPAQLKRDFLHEYVRLQALKEKGGLPKVHWKKYRVSKTGFTEDVLNESLLESYK